jgi:DNA polymerase-3 subunit chi
MARVDFYVLADAGEAARTLFACRLAEKAYRLDNTVHIRTGDRGLAGKIDELLWTFRDGSFVPHEILNTGGPAEAPITIGIEASSGAAADLLINLSSEVPDDVATFPRIAEIVSSDEDSRLQSRQRFAAYRKQGHTLDTHNI